MKEVNTVYDITAVHAHGRDLDTLSNTFDKVLDADTHTAEVISTGLAELAGLITQLGRVLAL